MILSCFGYIWIYFIADLEFVKIIDLFISRFGYTITRFNYNLLALAVWSFTFYFEFYEVLSNQSWLLWEKLELVLPCFFELYNGFVFCIHSLYQWRPFFKWKLIFSLFLSSCSTLDLDYSFAWTKQNNLIQSSFWLF